MKYKKVLLYGCVFSLLVVGAAYRYWYPMVRNEIQKQVDSYTQKDVVFEEISTKATRHIPENADLGAYLAGTYAVDTQNYPAAAAYFEKVLAADAENHLVQSNLLALYTILGQINKAIPLAYKELGIERVDTANESTQGVRSFKGKQLLQSDSNAYIARHVIAADLVKQGAYKDIISYYQNKENTATDVLIKPIVLAWSYASLNQSEKAFDALDTLNDTRLGSIKQYHKALLLAYFGRKAEAQEIYRSLNVKEIISANVWLSMAAMFQGTSEWKEGQPLYDHFIGYLRRKTTLFDLLRQVGLRPVETPQQAIAEAYYTIALASAGSDHMEVGVLFNNLAYYIDPESNLVKVSLAEIFQNLGMYERANEIYDSIDPSSDITQFKKALNLMILNENEAALSILYDLEKRNKNNYFIKELIGDAHRDNGQMEQAISAYTQAVNLLKKSNQNQRAAEILLNMAYIYETMRKPDVKLSLLKESFRLDNANPNILNDLGYELIDSDIDVANGLKLVQKANEMNPSAPQIMDSLAWGYYKSGAYDKALTYSKQAVEEAPGNATMHSHLGDIYTALGRHLEAESQYRKALTAQVETTPALKEELHQKLNEPLTETDESQTTGQSDSAD